MRHDHTIHRLNELISVTRDGEAGFAACAEHVRSAPLRRLLRDRARSCAAAAHELRALVRQLGGNPYAGGTIAGVMHRRWVNVRTALTSDDEAAVLAECERGEDYALEVYRNALDDHLPDFVRRVVLEQFEGVMRHHDQIRELQARHALPGPVGRVVREARP